MANQRTRPAVNNEPRWHASLAVLVAVALYISLPAKITFGQSWLFPLLVLVLLVPLSVFAPLRAKETSAQRFASIALIAIINLFNLYSVLMLVSRLIHPAHHVARTGQELLLGGIEIWIMNILAFSLWYWELDAGGPAVRARGKSAADFANPDFQFPQMVGGGPGPAMCADTGWKPLFIDYLYLAFNTATALSPADTFPLSRLGKMLMMAQSAISFTTIAVVVSRAVNILG